MITNKVIPAYTLKDQMNNALYDAQNYLGIIANGTLDPDGLKFLCDHLRNALNTIEEVANQTYTEIEASENKSKYQLALNVIKAVDGDNAILFTSSALTFMRVQDMGYEWNGKEWAKPEVQ